MNGADFYIADWAGGAMNLVDKYFSPYQENGFPLTDPIQSIEMPSGAQESGRTWFKFTRALNTNDARDTLDLANGQERDILIAHGTQQSLGYHGVNRVQFRGVF